MKKRCPFCHAELEILQKVGATGRCRCGAWGRIHLLSDAHAFPEEAKKTLDVKPAEKSRLIEVVDGGIVFEEKGEPVIIQWAKKPV